jgi:hypothetical protein
LTTTPNWELVEKTIDQLKRDYRHTKDIRLIHWSLNNDEKVFDCFHLQLSTGFILPEHFCQLFDTLSRNGVYVERNIEFAGDLCWTIVYDKLLQKTTQDIKIVQKRKTSATGCKFFK